MIVIEVVQMIDQLMKANSVHWHGPVLRKDKNNFLRRALDLKVKGTRKR